MADKDRTKWNRKYQKKPALLESRPPSALLERFYQEAPGRQALDLACGSGRHTLFLAQNGFHVDAVDISSVALETLAEKTADLPVTLIEADLDTFTPQENHYDLALMTNYLDRALILRALDALRHGGLLIVETYMMHEANEKQDSNPDFFLQAEELKRLLETKGDVLAYEEFWNEPYELYRMRKQGIVLQKN